MPEEGGDHANVPAPCLITPVYAEQQLHITALGPLLELIFEEQLRRSARSVEDDHPSKQGALIQHLVNQGARWRQPQPAGGEEYILAPEAFNGETAPEWPADPHPVSGFQVVQRTGDITHLAHAQLEVAIAAAGRAADADRRFSNAEHRDFDKLPRAVSQGSALRQLQGKHLFQSSNRLNFYNFSQLRDEELVFDEWLFSHRSNSCSSHHVLPPISCCRYSSLNTPTGVIYTREARA